MSEKDSYILLGFILFLQIKLMTIDQLWKDLCPIPYF